MSSVLRQGAHAARSQEIPVGNFLHCVNRFAVGRRPGLRNLDDDPPDIVRRTAHCSQINPLDYPCVSAEGADPIWVEAGVSLGGFERIEQVIGGSIPAVGPMMIGQVLPQALHRIEFRRVRWQADDDLFELAESTAHKKRLNPKRIASVCARRITFKRAANCWDPSQVSKQISTRAPRSTHEDESTKTPTRSENAEKGKAEGPLRSPLGVGSDPKTNVVFCCFVIFCRFKTSPKRVRLMCLLVATYAETGEAQGLIPPATRHDHRQPVFGPTVGDTASRHFRTLLV